MGSVHGVSDGFPGVSEVIPIPPPIPFSLLYLKLLSVSHLAGPFT